MKKILSLLLITALLLSGCSIKWEDSASTDSYVEKEPAIEQWKEEDQPKEEVSSEEIAGGKENSDADQGGEQAEEVPATEDDQEEKPAEESEKTVIHRFWETEEEMPYEEAVAIVKEKVENRPFEPLTDKERMAYYQCIFNTMSVYYNASLENFKKNGPPKEENLDQWYHAEVKAPIFGIELLTTDAGVHFDLLKNHPLKFEDEKYEVLDIIAPKEIKETTKDSYVQQQDLGIIVKENGTILDAFYDSIDLKHGSGRVVYYFAFKDVNVFEQELSNQSIQNIVRHYLSLDFVTWMDLTCDYEVRVIDD